MTLFAPTPKPPYYAVIFTSELSADTDGYAQMGERMMELAAQQDGFLGVESTRNEDGYGITVSYWKDDASIQAWKQNTEHLEAQQKGKHQWYKSYHLRVAKVER